MNQKYGQIMGIQTYKLSDNMAISEKEYIDLKEYWDYQRKREYNKEQLRDSTDKMHGRLFTGNGMAVSVDEIFDMVWSKFPEAELEEPPKHWIPRDDKLKKWNEIHNEKDNK